MGDSAQCSTASFHPSVTHHALHALHAYLPIQKYMQCMSPYSLSSRKAMDAVFVLRERTISDTPGVLWHYRL